MTKDQIEKLRILRKAMEEEAEGCSLTNTYSSIGFLFIDVAEALGLDDEQRHAFLGTNLTYAENQPIDCVLPEPAVPVDQEPLLVSL